MLGGRATAVVRVACRVPRVVGADCSSTREGPFVRGRAVDLGITVAQALAPLRPDGANDSLGSTPELTPGRRSGDRRGRAPHGQAAQPE